VESTCYRCRAPVESGVLFCKHCGAPQIRVAIEPRPHQDALVGPAPGEPSLTISKRVGAQVFDWSEARRTTILGGLVEAVLALFGLGFVGIPAGAFFSVVFYKRRTAAKNLTSGLGARLGLISGAVGFAIFALLASLEMLLSTSGAGLREQVMKQLEQTAAQYPAEAQQAMEYLRSAQGWGLVVALATISILVAFLLLSTIGGAVGGAVLGRRQR
jgi:hypothetical protein